MHAWIVVGTEVAVVSWGGFGPRRILKRKIGKVYANGRFQLLSQDGQAIDAQVWRCRSDHNESADPSPKKNWMRTCVQPWTAQHGAEIERNKLERDLENKVRKLHDAFETMHGNHTNVVANAVTIDHIGQCLVAMAFAPK